VRAPEYLASWDHAPDAERGVSVAFSTTVDRKYDKFRNKPDACTAQLICRLPRLIEIAGTIPENSWYTGKIAAVTRGSKAEVSSEEVQKPNESQFLHMLRLSAGKECVNTMLNEFLGPLLTLLSFVGLTKRSGRKKPSHMQLNKVEFLAKATQIFESS